VKKDWNLKIETQGSFWNRFRMGIGAENATQIQMQQQ
jgi:hypothetical protein